MNVLNELEPVVRRKLTDFLNARFFNIHWSSFTLRGYGQIDVYGASPKYACIIEIELKREDPVNNVAKIYRYMNEDGNLFSGKEVIFVHAFSLKYRSGGYETKRKNAEFIGRKMRETYNIEYHSMSYDSMESLKTEVAKLLEAIF